MSPVEFKKTSCRPVEFKGQGPQSARPFEVQVGARTLPLPLAGQWAPFADHEGQTSLSPIPGPGRVGGGGGPFKPAQTYLRCADGPLRLRRRGHLVWERGSCHHREGCIRCIIIIIMLIPGLIPG